MVTSSDCSGVVRDETRGCSGARDTYVTPITVSGRVVNTEMSEPMSVEKTMSQPVDLPIHYDEGRERSECGKGC